MTTSLSGRHAALALATLGLFGACNDGGGLVRNTPAPHDVGLVWTASEQVERTSTSYKATPDGGVVEQKGTVGSGESRSDASSSTGTLLVTEIVERTHRNEVVGNTVTDHPLNPGPDTFGPIGLSVVAEQINEVGSTQRLETFIAPGSSPSQWEETDAGALGQSTNARYHGVAADEYVVSLFPLDLWSSTLDTDIPLRADTGFGEGLSGGSNNLTLLTKHQPRTGDLWTSLNNRMIYVFDGTENLNVGGKGVKTDRVKVYMNENYDADAGDVLGDCLREGPFEDTTTFPDAESTVTTQLDLDEGCADTFLHAEIGTQWWYDNALVQFEGRRVFVTITDWGYEWYDDDDSDIWTRFTSSVKAADFPDANPFVEYTVTVEESRYVVDTWNTDGGSSEE